MEIRKILIIPDSFKGTLSSLEVSNIIEDAFVKEFNNIQCIKLPYADGGEGLVQSILYSCSGEKICVNARDPLWRKVNAEYGIINSDTAVIEMSAASGLTLLNPGELNGSKTTSYGTGELIFDAINRGCNKIILGIGGSATIDGGLGAAAALGIRFLTEDGEDVPLSGDGLRLLHSIDIDNMLTKLKECEIIVACDVNNVLYGENGAAYVYGPQKGVSKSDMNLLDKGLRNLAHIIEKQTEKRLSEIPGIGAAGGMALPFMAFANAKLCPGWEIVLDILNINEHLIDCDLVITGEGKIDGQSAMGKALYGIISRARKMEVPVIAICGSIGEGFEDMYDIGLTSIFNTCRSIEPLEYILKNSKKNLKATAKDVARLLKLMSR